MTVRRRPLFLIPSLMESARSVAASLGELTSGLTDAYDTPYTRAGSELLANLEPLLVEATLAGYEVTAVAVGTGAATSPVMLLDIPTYFIHPQNQPWSTAVGVNVSWSSVSAAVGLRFMPRLALRDAIDGGSLIASSYGIPFTTPSGWLGAVSSNDGGWLVATIPAATAVSLPADLGGISRKLPMAALREAIRSAAEARWNIHGRQPTQLANCGLAPIFDPAVWVRPPDDVGVGVLADRVASDVWQSGSGTLPSYGDLVSLSLTDLLHRSRGTSGAIRVLEAVQQPLREEAARRQLGDPARIPATSYYEGDLASRHQAVLAELQPFGIRPWPLDLFHLLEMGMFSLARRVADEETFPALIEREWSEPILTGIYDLSADVPDINTAELDNLDTAEALFEAVALVSDVVLMHQAGDRIDGLWQQRLYVPQAGDPVRLVTWTFDGTRDRSKPGLVFSCFFSTGSQTGSGVFSFAEGADGLVDATLDWGGAIYPLRQRGDNGVMVRPASDEPQPPEVPMVRTHLNDAQIASLDPAIGVWVEVIERYTLHPAEMALLAGICDLLAEDLEVIAQTSGVSTPQRQALCSHLESAFAYFYQGGSGSKHLLLARAYVRMRLGSMPGDGTPLDPVVGPPPETYWRALVDAQATLPCQVITDGIGLSAADAQAGQVTHKYQWKFRSGFGTGDNFLLQKMKKKTLDKVVEKALTYLVGKAVWVLGKVDDIEFGIAPDVQFDLIEAEFQKVKPYPDPDWPGTEQHPVSVLYDGALFGLGVAASAGMKLTWESEWSSVETFSIPWSPDDFAGSLAIVAIYAGYSIVGIERANEAIPNWVHKAFGTGTTVRVSGDVSYTHFMTEGKEDVWAVQLGFTNTFGLHAEMGAGGTGGYLWRRGEPPPNVEEIIDVERYTGDTFARGAVSFSVGRSELTPLGEDLLREAANYHLNELASPSTTLVVKGHANPGDARELYNLTLSEHRAANVVRYLRSYLGPMFAIPDEHIRIQGMGQTEAEEDGAGDPPEDWRKVDVLLNGRLAVRMATE